jgi:hypothetical protein
MRLLAAARRDEGRAVVAAAAPLAVIGAVLFRLAALWEPRHGRLAPHDLLSFTAEPDTKSDEALNLLGSWAATVEQEQTAPTIGET